jgi:hypothetical protein
MHFAIASCGMSVHKVGAALIKSLALFSRPGDRIVLHVFTSTDSAVKEIDGLLKKVCIENKVITNICQR